MNEQELQMLDMLLVGIGKQRAALDAREAKLLVSADEARIWERFGFVSMIEYMHRKLGYPPRVASERLRVARALMDLPVMADTMERGELCYSKVRELTRIAVPETEVEWVEAAVGVTTR